MTMYECVHVFEYVHVCVSVCLHAYVCVFAGNIPVTDNSWKTGSRGTLHHQAGEVP